jgi:hypothetical protein
MPEGLAIGLRTCVDNPAEVLPQVSRGGESAASSDHLDRQITGFEQPLGQLDPLRL